MVETYVKNKNFDLPAVQISFDSTLLSNTKKQIQYAANKQLLTQWYTQKGIGCKKKLYERENFLFIKGIVGKLIRHT